jgi:hypothetical protein
MFSGGRTLGGGTVRLGRHARLIDEVLEAPGREHPDHPSAVRPDREPVGDVAGPERVLAGSQLDGLVADDDRHAALEHVEALVLCVGGSRNRPSHPLREVRRSRRRDAYWPLAAVSATEQQHFRDGFMQQPRRDPGAPRHATPAVAPPGKAGVGGRGTSPGWSAQSRIGAIRTSSSSSSGSRSMPVCDAISKPPPTS